MSGDAAYLALLHRAREQTLLGSCATLLEWDEDVDTSESGAEPRAEQQTLVAPPLRSGERWPTSRGPEGKAMVKDPVCGMNVDESRAAATATSRGRTDHFCSPAREATSEKAREKYASR